MLRYLLLFGLCCALVLSYAPASAQEGPTPTDVPVPTGTPDAVPTNTPVPTPAQNVCVNELGTTTPCHNETPTIPPGGVPTTAPTSAAVQVCDGAICGTPVVVVGWADGAQGVQLLLVLVNLLGVTALIILKLCDMFLLRRT